MKHLKKLGVLAMAVVLCISLASCGGVVPSSYLEVDPATGAGKANFTMSVPKNGAEGIGNNFVVADGDNPNVNQGYITSADALLKLMKSKVPSGFEVTMKEQTKMEDIIDEDTEEVTGQRDTGSYDYTVTFSFSDIKDYNAKIKEWLPAKYWDLAKTALNDEVKEAAMETTGDAKSANVSLTVDMRILEVVCQWVYDVISTDTTGAVIDGGSGFQYQYVYNMDKGSFTVKFNGKETNKPYSATKGEIKAEATGIDTTEEPEPTETPSPSTGEPLAISAVLLTAAAAGALLIARKRSK